MKVSVLALLLLFPLNAFSAEERKVDAVAYSKCHDLTTSRSKDVVAIKAACEPLARSGFPPIQFAYGIGLLNGGADREEALRWIASAAKAGHPGAQFELGILLAQSEDIERRQEARTLLRAAFCAGYPDAVKAAEKAGATKTSVGCPADPLRNFDGTWTAMLARSEPSQKSAKEFEYQIRIANGKASVFVKMDDGLVEAKPGAFKIEQVDETLIVSALDSGWDLDGKWIESWVFHMLRLSADEARVTFTRTVSNVYVPNDFQYRTIATFDTGEARRTSASPDK